MKRPYWVMIFAALLCLCAACSSGGGGAGSSSDYDADDDQVDDDADDDSSDDDLDDDADDDVDDDIDDDVDDDTSDDDTAPYYGLQTPCDITGDGPEYLLEEHYTDGGQMNVKVTVKTVDGAVVHVIDPVALGAYGFGYHYLADLDGDGRCEVISQRQYIDLNGSTVVTKGRVIVFDGPGFTVAYDTGWLNNEYVFAYPNLDITGDGRPDLLLSSRPIDDGHSGSLKAIDAANGYDELWTINGGNGEGLALHGVNFSGAVGSACGDASGPDAFLLERYDLYDTNSPQWRAQWIDRGGHAVGDFGPLDLRQAALSSAGLMVRSPDDRTCAGFVAYPKADSSGSRFVLFDRGGATLAQGTLANITAISGVVSMSLDGDELPDVVLWGSDAGGAPSLWVGPNSDNFALQQVASGLASGLYYPVAWTVEPWLAAAVDLRGHGEQEFAIVPFSTDVSGALHIDLYGTDLQPAGFYYDMPLPAGGLLTAGGWSLYLSPLADPALLAYALTAEGSAPSTIHSAWAVFAGDHAAPLHQEDMPAGVTAFPCSTWDFDNDGRPEICELRQSTDTQGGQVRLYDTATNYAVVLAELGAAGHRLAIYGAWK